MNNWGAENKAFLFLIDFEMKDIHVWPSGSIPEHIQSCFAQAKNKKGSNKQLDHNPIKEIIPYSKEDYTNAFEAVIQEIKYGNSFLLNLTARSEINLSLDLEEIYEISRSKYKFLWKDRFVSFSPETFVRIEHGKISGYPMKGTIDARIPDAEKIILEDKKEKAEHNTIVDLIRNDLSMNAKKVSVPRFRYVEKIQSKSNNLLQVSSMVEGVLPENYNKRIGEILFDMLPAGSISGAPKSKTVEIIQSAEPLARGYYTGIAGYFDGMNLDSCVLIRFIEKEGTRYYYRSGGGITSMSDLDKEYDEMIQKIYVPTH